MASAAREVATEIVRKLRAAGREGVFAGGCVRDELLGLLPEDYDVATDARPEEVERLFPGAREVGKIFGVVPVVRTVRGERVVVEVATFREDAAYTDKRRPDSVTFSDARNDALRRDFTINALFIDPLDTKERQGGRVIDHVGGLADLSARVIRAVGDPEARLAEDHLRALRAVRFAARLGFAIDGPTAAAISGHARDLAGVSRERIGDELRKMLKHPTRGRAVELIHELGLDASVLEDGRLMTGFRATTVSGLPKEATAVTAMAAWAIDRIDVSGNRATGEAISEAAEANATAWRRALCLSNDERTELAAVLNGVGLVLTQWSGAGVARRRRQAASGWFGAAMQIADVREPRRAAGIRGDVETLVKEHGELTPAAFVTGDDLVAAGLKPGPLFGRLLEAVYDAQLESRVTDRGAAMELALRLAREGMPGGGAGGNRGKGHADGGSLK